ncbi:hypothetical protein BGZ58_004398 [Dissophora ornata]|nr:hypothetical protein BGZ58_004398 [Dissophora ornata]
MSVAILHKGELIFAEGFGKRNDQEPFTAETIMPIASCTKAFTATAIGELVAEGKMDWDTTPISKYLPEFELQDQVLTSQLTLLDLLSHRSGFPNIDFSWYRTKESRRDLIKRLKHVKVDPKLRSTMLYNNVMYSVAGEAAANVAGVSYEEVVKTKVLEPLGLTSSGFYPMEMMEKHTNYALPYSAKSFEDAQKQKFNKERIDEIYMAMAPAGDMYSNVLDLVNWGQVVMRFGKSHDGKQILNRKSVEETLSGQSIIEKTRRTSEFAPTLVYGLGWCLDTYKGQITYSHDGAIPGYRSNLTMFPDAELVVAILANVGITQLPDNMPFYVADELLNLPRTQDWISKVSLKDTKAVYDFYDKEAKGQFPERIKNKPTSHDAESLVGKYTHPVFGEADILMPEGTRDLHLWMRRVEGKLEHYHFDSFNTVMRDGYAKSGLFVTFLTSESGKVAGFRIKLVEQTIEFEKEEKGGSDKMTNRSE